MALEPIRRAADDRVHGAKFRKKVGSAGDDLKFFRTPQPREGLLVELEHAGIGPAYDEERRRTHAIKRLPREVGAPTPRYDCRDTCRLSSANHERRGRSGACAKEANAMVARRTFGGGPVHRRFKTGREKRNIEDVAAREFLGGRQKVEKKRGDAAPIESARDPDVSRAEPARAAPVREKHEATGLGRDKESRSRTCREDENLSVGVCAPKASADARIVAHAMASRR